MNYNLRFSHLCVFSVCTAFQIHVYAAVPDELREHSVISIRQGKVDQGLSELKALLQQYPDNQKLIADYTVLSYVHGKFAVSDEAFFSQINPQTFPDYGKVSVLRALRDLQHYDSALIWARKFDQAAPAQEWKIWQGVLLAESGQKMQAQKLLQDVKMQGLSADYLTQLSYAYRIVDMPADALNAADLSLQQKQTRDAQEQYVLALLANSDFIKAQEYINRWQMNAAMPQVQHALKMADFTQRIQQGIQASKNALNMKRGETANIALDKVLADMQAYELQLPDDINARRKFYHEYIFALNARGNAAQAVAQVPKTQQDEMAQPAYVRHALADSYLKLRKPKQAEILYKSLFAEKNYADFNVYSGLYYSLIEQEKFKEGDQLIQQMDQLLPTYVYSSAKGVDKAPHEDRQEYFALKGLNYAYRNEQAKAEAYFNELNTKAPGNISYLNNLAQIQRWREKPEQSQQTISQLSSLEPEDQSSQINQMQNAQAMDQIQSWRAFNQYLMLTAGQDTGVLESKKELEDRNRPTIQHQSTWGKSTSDNQDILGRLKGTRELESSTRLNSPWIYDNFRLFADYSERWSNYESGKLKDKRIGAGAEWSDNRKTASAMLSQNTDGEHTGVELNWSQWLNDHWNYNLGYNSQADIPLQALAQGHEGQSYNMGLNWQANESRKAGLGYQYTDIDDGNKRQEASGYFKQQFQQSPHHISSAVLRGYYGHNTADLNVPYFNPENSYSAEISLVHDWMTWRQYERHFSQHFEATAGTYRQTGFSNKPIYNLYYQHDWKLSRTWGLNYGIGWGSHPYDGVDEKRTYAVFGFEGRF